MTHAHGHTAHEAGHRPRHGNALTAALSLTLGFAGVEALAGWWSGSLALLGDAGHMVTDSTALGLAALAAWIARRPPSALHSYGLGRAEVLAAMVNGLFMLMLVAAIAVAAVERLHDFRPVAGGTAMGVAAAGLGVNTLVMLLLSRGEQSINTRGALLHVLGDLLGSVAALLSGTVIYFTGWLPADPLASLFICALILFSSLRLLREAVHVLMEGVPLHMDLPEVGRAMAGVAGVKSVHDLHIWTPSSGQIALSAHVVVADLAAWDGTLQRLHTLLHDRFGVVHITLQPEPLHQVLHLIRPGDDPTPPIG